MPSKKRRYTARQRRFFHVVAAGRSYKRTKLTKRKAAVLAAEADTQASRKAGSMKRRSTKKKRSTRGHTHRHHHSPGHKHRHGRTVYPKRRRRKRR